MENKALTEAEAFQYLTEEDRYKQGFDDGYKVGLEEAQQVTLDKFTGIIEENTELRRQVREMEIRNSRMREAILRGMEEEWE